MIRPFVAKALAIHPVFGHISVPLYRNGYALILSSTATSALGLLYWAIAARLYDANTVGINSAILSAMMFLSIVAQLNLGGMLVRYVPLAGGATARLIRVAYIASVVAAVLVCAVFLVGLEIWSPSLRVLGQNPFLMVGFILATVMWCIFALQDSALTALRQSVWVPVENIVFAALKIVLLVAGARLLTGYGIFASWIIPVGLALIPINWFLFTHFIPAHVRTTKERAVPIERGDLVKYIGGNYVGAIFFQASATLLPLIVIGQLGAAMNAYFYLPWTITTSLQMVALNMSTSFTVEASRDLSQRYVYGGRVLVHNLKILVPLVLVVVVGAPYLLGFFGAEYARQGSTMLRLLALSVIPYSFVSLYVGLERVQNRVHHIAVVQAIRCIALLALAYWLLPQWGIVAAGVIWLAVESCVGGFLLVTRLRPLLHPQIITEQKEQPA